MNTIKDIFIDKGSEPKRTTLTIFFTSKPDEIRSEINHCEILKADEIRRITLNQSSFTLVYKSGGFKKFGVLNTFNIQKIADLAEIRFNKNAGLKVIEHFTNLKTVNNKN